MSGLSVGILSGLVVATVGVAAVSLSTPLPPRDGSVVVVNPVVVEGGAAQEVPVEGGAADPVEQGATAPEQTQASPVDLGAPEAEPEDTTPGTEAPATEIPLPAGTEFNRAPPEPEAALPSAETAPVSSAPLAPSLGGDVTAPSFDASPAGQPNVGADAPAALSLAADAGAAPASPAAAPAPAIGDSPTALTQPDPTASPDVETAALALAEEVTPEVAPTQEPAVAPIEEDTAEPVEEVVAPVEEAVTPVAEDAPVPVAEVAEAGPEASPDPVVEPLQTPVFPTIGDGAGQDSMTPEAPDAPAQDVAGLRAPVFPQTSSLPQAGVAQPEVTEPEEPVEVDIASLPAIQAFATEFDAADARALIAVLLIDDPDSPIELETLTRFTFPVAFAIDPLHPDAAMRAATYREAGFEVVMLGSMIAEGATPADVEVAMEAAFQIVPEAVALLDTADSRIQADRPVLDAVVGALAETGHGLVAFPRGLNAAEQSANRLGVPGATVFRMLDDEGQRATVITRFLTRAAFSAGQEGAVIVVGHTRPDTVTALFSWALGGRSEGVTLAPLSATIERAAGL